MSYMDLLPATEPRNANERIARIKANGTRFTEYELRSNGDVLGAVESGGWWHDVLVPADGGKARVIA